MRDRSSEARRTYTARIAIEGLNRAWSALMCRRGGSPGRPIDRHQVAGSRDGHDVPRGLLHLETAQRRCSMKLSSELARRVEEQIEGEAIPEDHPLSPRLQNAFGDHTFFLSPDGLTIVA